MNVSMFYPILLTLGGLITICGAWVQYFKELESKRKSELLAIENKSLLKKIVNSSEDLNSALSASNDQISSMAKELVVANKKINDKSDYIESSLTGGNAFPFLDIRSLGNTENSFLFQIENDFNFPLYNLDISVFDYSKIESKLYKIENQSSPAIKMADYKSARILTKSYQELPGHQFSTIDQTFIRNTGKYYIQIHARNRSVVEKIVVIKIGQGYYYGFQVLTLNGTVLKVLIKEDMPKNIQALVMAELETIPLNMKLVLTE